jgi:hypothetical protein
VALPRRRPRACRLHIKPDGTPSAAAAELHGRLWQRLGIDRLDRIAFQRLASGLHPLTGERLVKASHAARIDPLSGAPVPCGGMRVPGIDCYLSPPKSVSALLPFATPDQRAALESAHQAAVDVTLEELEARVAACRPTVNGEQVHTPGELVAADRAACQAIRDGRAPEALASLHARGRLHLAPDRSATVKEVVHAWDRHRAVRGLDGVAVVTDTDNATVDVLSAVPGQAHHRRGARRHCRHGC